MIDLNVDEAYAFDYLSILFVKNSRYPSDKNLDLYNKCFGNMSQQLGEDVFKKIISSTQYKNLTDINFHTFDLIDFLREGKDISAKMIDDANMERYYRKKDLQEFFFHSNLQETKICKK